MMVFVKHLVNVLVNPLAFALVAFAAGFLSVLWERHAVRTARFPWRKAGIALAVAGGVWCWFWSTGVGMRIVGVALERAWPAQTADAMPLADAIVLLGGGMGANRPPHPYPEMFSAADRVWHAARLYRAGKAPYVITSGNADRISTMPLLKDLGVPESAIRCENRSRNTEENAAFVAELFAAGGVAKPRILLVTSAAHMTRARMMFSRYAPGIDVVPAATDYEATVHAAEPIKYDDFLPAAEALWYNTTYFKEILGQLAYRLIRR